jgi:hypothetical protein
VQASAYFAPLVTSQSVQDERRDETSAGYGSALAVAAGLLIAAATLPSKATAEAGGMSPVTQVDQPSR